MIDIVLQGPLNGYAVEVANHYSKLSFVSKIIMSGWSTDTYSGGAPNPKIIIISSIPPDMPGVGNRNMQILSSRHGLRYCRGDIAVKMRNDQKVSLDSMKLMYDYYQANKMPKKIFVPGIFPTFPFHPRDHIFWGQTGDLKLLFDIPFDEESLSDDYTKYLRSEAYICMYYYGMYSPEAAGMILCKEDYLLDNSPKRNQAIELTKRLDLFKPFPKIDFEWPKYGMTSYHYEYTNRVYGEYQADTIL